MFLIAVIVALVGFVPALIAEFGWFDWLTKDSGLVVYSTKFFDLSYDYLIRQDYRIGLGIVVYVFAIFAGYQEKVSDETCPN
jgi:hypothetical protein